MTTFEDIVRLETEHKLFDVQTAKGIFLWDILRPYLILQCLGHRSLRSRAHRPFSIIRKAWEYANLSARTIFALRKSRGRNILMFGTASRQPCGNVADRYLGDIRNSLDGLPVLRVEFGSFSLIPKRSEVIVFNHLFIVATAVLRLWFGCVVSNDRSLCLQLRKIAKLFSTDLTAASPAISSLRSQYSTFLAEAAVYGLLFDYTGCKAVIFTHNGMLRGLIHAARKRDITLIEMQHGEIASTTPFYSYPVKGLYARQIYAPDYFLLIGRYWGRNVTLPDDVSVRVIGNTCCSQSPMRSANASGGLLIIVNSATGEAAVAFLLEALKRVPSLSSKQIYLKLHPQQLHEVGFFRKKFQHHPGVNVICDEHSVYDLLDRVSQVVVFGNSTVIYEAYQSGVPVIVQHLGCVNAPLLGADLPGIAYSQSLLSFISLISEQPAAKRAPPADCTEFFSVFSPTQLPAILHVGGT